MAEVSASPGAIPGRFFFALLPASMVAMTATAAPLVKTGVGHRSHFVRFSDKSSADLQACITRQLAALGSPAVAPELGRTKLDFDGRPPPIRVVINEIPARESVASAAGMPGSFQIAARRSIELWRRGPVDRTIRLGVYRCL